MTFCLHIGKNTAMDIPTDIREFLTVSGWTAKRLAVEAGVEPSTITRLVRGERQGVNSRTLDKLWPFLYGDRRPVPVPPAGAETVSEPPAAA